jgi:hypothetical protein
MHKGVVLRAYDEVNCIKVLRTRDGVAHAQKNILDEKQFLIKY